MTILAGDIKLVKSAVMNDVPEGGGAPTSNIINDGTSNSIFPDISEIDRAGGRVNLRKVFATVRTPNVDGFYGVNIIVAEPFEDPRVSATLFTTQDFFDTRSEAASRLESYLAKGTTYSGLLLGDHLAGQSSVTLQQRIEVPPPVVGQTLVLTKNLGLPTEFVQFVRVTGVSVTERTFSDANSASLGDFQRLQVVLTISDQLQEDFPGFDAIRFDASISYTGKTKVNDTIVADAARYYGVVPLEDPVAIGDFTVQAEGIFTQLVPSTRIEVPIADSRMNQQSATLVKAGEPYNRNVSMVFTTGISMFVGGGVLPGSLTISRGGITIRDKGGLLLDISNAQVGTFDYENGVATLSSDVFGSSSGTHAVVYTPATAPTLVSESFGLPVTAETQRLSWVNTIDPAPVRGSLQISYRALGRWYVLKDDGSGALRGGDSSIGAGTINFDTGTVSVTLGALPDVGSSLIYTFVPGAISRPVETLPLIGPALPRAFGKIVSLGQAIKPGTITITWNDGAARTATDSGGVLTGDATGQVNYGAGTIDFRPNTLPAKGTSVSIAITEATSSTHAVSTFTDGGANWTFTLPGPIKENSLELAILGEYISNWAWGRTEPTNTTIRLFDDGLGNLKYANNDANVTIGSVNYSTGACSIPKVIGDFKVDQPALGQGFGSGIYRNSVGGFASVAATVNVQNGPGPSTYGAPSWSWWAGNQTGAVEARYAGADGAADTYGFTLDDIFMPASRGGYNASYGGSPRITSFILGTDFYVRRDAQFQRNPSPTTGLGTVSGSASVIGGFAGVLLTEWVAGISSAPTGVAGAADVNLSGQTPIVVDGAMFRTAVAPLVNSGFQIAGNWYVGGAGFTATPNSAGEVVSGTNFVGVTPGSLGVFGLVDYEQGIADLYFGQRVPASMAADDFVVDLSYLGIVDVEYVKLAGVQADTLRYNAVGYSYLPLDPDILGLNPVRLPADGRVPIFRPGSFAVLGHTGEITATVTNGQVVNCARTRLSRVRVIGNDGLVIDTGYTADLDLGLVTFTDVTGYSQPVTVQHRIEDTVLVSDAQISGQISFTRPSTHVYPVPGSYISSALVAGDVFARTSVVFDQSTWNNTWSDSASGSSATGTFDDTTYPIAVTNLGALTERWAIVFTNTTTFNVIGENVGVIATGNTGTNCAPTNPATGAPYFTIPFLGWGLGWAAGNVLRFNTVGAVVPVWVARTILQGPETVTDDDFTILVRGDVDRP